MYETSKQEQALLVIVEEKEEQWSADVLASEFRNLVISTGISVSDLVFIKRREPNPSLYIGKGKAQELAEIVQAKGADVVIFNNNLTSAQQRNLEDVFDIKTIDRTQLILDIFAAHARTQEGILQVELAQLEYLLPRLKGKGIALSRLGGGIGTRGPGEKKLEVDRRHISDRITRLKKELSQVRQHREVMRKKREKAGTPLCSLVGYTNAGKSTLFNALSNEREQTSSAMFTTLDTVSRTISLQKDLEILLSDTVGFIYKLPPYLVESFKATLEELNYADIILHVLDSSSSDTTRLCQAVDAILEELNLQDKPSLLILNKVDLLSDEDLRHLRREFPEGVFVSALNKSNIDELKEKIYTELFGDRIEAILRITFDKMALVKDIHSRCEVIESSYQEDAALYKVRMKKENIDFFQSKGISVEIK